MRGLRLISVGSLVMCTATVASASVWTNATGNRLFSDPGNWDDNTVPGYGNGWAEV